MGYAIRFRHWAASLGVLASALAGHAAESAFIVEGYWAWNGNPSDAYPRYLRITGDSGYYCFLDGKSGFAFAIAKDSITTPMNGKNAIQWMPGSGDIVIAGQEKGEPYTERFHPSDSATYWSQCRDQDPRSGPTGLRGKARRSGEGIGPAPGRLPRLKEGYSLSGRKVRWRR